MANKFKLDSGILNAALYVLAGLLFCILRGEVLSILFTVVGILFVVKAILHFLAKHYPNGAFSAVIGLILLIGGNLIVDVVLIVFGVFWIVQGALSLFAHVRSKNPAPMALLASAGTLLIGILLCVSNWLVVDWVFLIIGIVMIVDGVMSLFGSLRR